MADDSWFMCIGFRWQNFNVCVCICKWHSFIHTYLEEEEKKSSLHTFRCVCYFCEWLIEATVTATGGGGCGDNSVLVGAICIQLNSSYYSLYT